MTASTYLRLDCPHCQGPLIRVRRQAGEKSEPDIGALRRYRCQSADCAWQGLLPRRVRAPRRLLLRSAMRSARRVLLPGAAIASLALALVAVAWQAGLMAPAASRGYALGEHHDGEKLPAAHPLSRHHLRQQHVAPASVSLAAAPASPSTAAASTLQLRYGCVWGQPGRKPYRGSVEQALRSAALPEEVVKSIAAQVRAGQAVDRLEIRNDGVHAKASGRVFDARNIALTYDQTLCLGSRVNFPAGHMEPAALYEAATASGAVVAVMVPEVCGNVSVLGQSDDSVRLMQLNSNGAADAGVATARWMPAVLEGGSGAGGAFLPASTHDVPEPGTLACALAALAGWGVVLGLRRRWRLPGRPR